MTQQSLSLNPCNFFRPTTFHQILVIFPWKCPLYLPFIYYSVGTYLHSYSYHLILILNVFFSIFGIPDSPFRCTLYNVLLSLSLQSSLWTCLQAFAQLAPLSFCAQPGLLLRSSFDSFRKSWAHFTYLRILY
jgi:hypothetical protein